MSQRAFSACFELVSRFLEKETEMVFATCDGKPVLNGCVMAETNPVITRVVQHLEEREIGSFTLSQGLTGEEFVTLMAVLTDRPERLKELGGLENAIQALAIQAIRASSSEFVRAVGVGEGDGNGIGSGTGSKEDEKEDSKEEAEQAILNFLRGRAEENDKVVEDAAEKLAADPKALSRMVTQAAEENHTSVALQNGKTLTAMAVENLWRIPQQAGGWSTRRLSPRAWRRGPL